MNNVPRGPDPLDPKEGPSQGPGYDFDYDVVDQQTNEFSNAVRDNLPEMDKFESVTEAERRATETLKLGDRAESQQQVPQVVMVNAGTGGRSEEMVHTVAEEHSAATAGGAIIGGVGTGLAYAGGKFILDGASWLTAAAAGGAGALSGAGVGAIAGAGLYFIGRKHHFTARRGKKPRGMLGTMFIDGPVGAVMLPYVSAKNFFKRAFGKKNPTLQTV